MVEYESDRLHIVAAHHYSWGDHDPKWLLIDVGIQVLSGGALTVARRDFSIVRPDGEEVPLTSRRDYRRARAELLRLHLQLHTLAVDPIRSLLSRRSLSRSRLPILRRQRYPTIGGLRQSGRTLRTGRPVLRLPDRGAERGTYTLVIGGATDVRLPMEIE